MSLPKEIPDRLKSLSFRIADLDEGEGAWLRIDELAVLNSLGGTTVAVRAITLYERAPGSYVASDEPWQLEREVGESDVDYARRTREGAIEFITQRDGEAADTLFALSFAVWKEAA